MVVEFLTGYAPPLLEGPPMRKFGVPPGGATDADAAVLVRAMGATKLWEVWGFARLVIGQAGLVANAGTEREVFRNGKPVPANGCFPVSAEDLIEFRGEGVTVMGLGPSAHPGLRLDGPPVAVAESSPIRVIPLEDEAKVFCERSWTVSRERSRIGVRLEGEPMPGAAELPKSEPTVPGIIQLPPAGLPIILGQAGPTVGGYHKIGSVIEADLGRLAYATGLISFRLVTWEEAEAAFAGRIAQREARLKPLRWRLG